MRVTTETTRTATGFTLIELMVVISIIVLLLGIFVAVTTKALVVGQEAKAEQLLGRLSVALQTYKVDHKRFPPSVLPPSVSSSARTFGVLNSTLANFDSGHMLCQAMVGPLDKAGDNRQGMGWKKGNTVGRTYGPYYEPEPKELVRDDDVTDAFFLADSWGWPVMYFRATSQDTTMWGPDGRFDTDEHPRSGQMNPLTGSAEDDMILRSSQYLLGSAGGNTDPNVSVYYLGP